MTERSELPDGVPRKESGPGIEPGPKDETGKEIGMPEDVKPDERAQEKGAFTTEPEKPSDAALKYGARGLEVFPAPPGTKKSHKSAEHSGGAKWGKTADTGQIAKDWQKWPTANVGIATGANSGLWVIDLDKEPGGLEAWAALAGEHPPLPDTVTVETPSGGRHYWWQWPEGADIRNSAGKIGPGIDVRGEGGMVVAPPSVKPGRGAYVFALGLSPEDVPVADAPAWLVELALGASAKKPAPGIAVAAPGDDGPVRRMALRRKAETRLATALSELADAAEGTRNDTLNSIAYTVGGLMRFLPDDAARDGLLEAVAGWPDPEKNAQTIDRVLAEGAANPLDLELGGDDLLLSHEDMARAMVESGWAGDHRWVPQWGDWLGWADGVWRVRSDGDVMRDFRSFLNRAAGEVSEIAEEEVARIVALQSARSNRAMKTTTSVFKARNAVREKLGAVTFDKALDAKMRSEAGASAADFDADPLLLGTPGGVVDLRTGKLRQGRRGDMISRSGAVAPADEGARSEEWEAFLRSAFPDDPPMWDFLQRLAGYCLTGLTREERFFFFHGSGRNGKGTFLETLYALLGEYSTVAPSSLFLSNSNINEENFKSGLDGARMVWASEIPRGRTWNEAMLKELTGGDWIEAKRLYREAFNFKPQLTLIIAGNTQPNFHSVDVAIRSRLALVPFEQCFRGKEDRGLKTRLVGKEAPAIMRWAVDGAQKYLRDGLPLPQTVERASREYLDSEDKLLRFIEDRCERDDEAWISKPHLFESYCSWASEQRMKPITRQSFTKMLKEGGMQICQRKGSEGVKGLRLRADLPMM